MWKTSHLLRVVTRAIWRTLCVFPHAIKRFQKRFPSRYSIKNSIVAPSLTNFCSEPIMNCSVVKSALNHHTDSPVGGSTYDDLRCRRKSGVPQPGSWDHREHQHPFFFAEAREILSSPADLFEHDSDGAVRNG